MKFLTITGAVGLLLLGPCVVAHAQTTSPLDEVTKLAEKSKCAAVNWKNRGLAPKAYIRGMALVYAKAVCQQDRSDVKVVAAARGAPGSADDKTDALTWYDSNFSALGMKNDANGVDTLRHAYALLIGLGMRESSGQHCVGRDLSADFTSADSAEAGVFQTSFGASTKHATLPELTARYSANQNGCLLDVFRKNVSCSAHDAKTWGTGPGADWQKLTKSCPAFATEYAAVLIRVHGGSKGEFGPLRKKAAEVQPVCDAMLAEVQVLAQSKPEICAALK